MGLSSAKNYGEVKGKRKEGRARDNFKWTLITQSSGKEILSETWANMKENQIERWLEWSIQLILLEHLDSSYG
jgi:hypothetical protein